MQNFAPIHSMSCN